MQISYELTGFRPTGNGVPEAVQKALADTAAEVICRYTGREPVRRSGSTDCNIPLSMGIPAVSFGGYRGGGAHTRQEWVDAGSFEEGYNIILAFIGNISYGKTDTIRQSEYAGSPAVSWKRRADSG